VRIFPDHLEQDGGTHLSILSLQGELGSYRFLLMSLRISTA